MPTFKEGLRASLDLGTNTCLMLIADVSSSGEVLRTVSDFSTIVRLGQGVDQNRKLHPEARKRTLACLKHYAEILGEQGLKPDSAICVATSQARDAQDGAEFFAEIQQETGFHFEILSGDEEALFTFKGGLLPGMDTSRAVVLDIGGGSTELMAMASGESLDIGAVRFTERFLKSDPVLDSEFWACQDAIDEALEKLKTWRSQLKSPQLVAVAGTATTLAQWQIQQAQFNADAINEVILTRGDVHRQVEELKWRTVAERSELTGIEPGRADVSLAGAMIFWRVMEVLDFTKARISTRGLRYGVFQKHS